METMHAGLRALLDELEEWGRANDARTLERSGKVLNLNSETAGLICLLIRSGRRSRLLEICTSNGYSTIWLAWAASAVSLDGRSPASNGTPKSRPWPMRTCAAPDCGMSWTSCPAAPPK